MDMRDGFYQIHCDQTRMTNYRDIAGTTRVWKPRFMPFGLKFGTAFFQEAMDLVLDGLEGVAEYKDDILIWGDTHRKYNRTLAVFQRLMKFGLKSS